MGAALRSFDYYDFMEYSEEIVSSSSSSSATNDYFFIDNLDPSRPAVPMLDTGVVYTEAYSHGKITIMSAFRKDLFVSVTLPILALGALAFGAIGGSFLYTNSSFTRLDDHTIQLRKDMSEVVKIQAVNAQQISALEKAQQETNSKLDGTNSKLDKISDQLSGLATSMEVFKASQKQRPDS